MVSAEVMQPEQARQSASVIDAFSSFLNIGVVVVIVTFVNLL